MALTLIKEGEDIYFSEITRIKNIEQVERGHHIMILCQNEDAIDIWKVNVGSNGMRELFNYYRVTTGNVPDYVIV